MGYFSAPNVKLDTPEGAIYMGRCLLPVGRDACLLPVGRVPVGCLLPVGRCLLPACWPGVHDAYSDNYIQCRKKNLEMDTFKNVNIFFSVK